MPNLATPLIAVAGRLRFPWLFALTALVWIADIVIPDPLPLLDEIALGLLTLVLSQWRRRPAQHRADR